MHSRVLVTEGKGSKAELDKTALCVPKTHLISAWKSWVRVRETRAWGDSGLEEYEDDADSLSSLLFSSLLLALGPHLWSFFLSLLP